MREGVSQCGRVSSVCEGVPKSRRVYPSVGRCSPVWEGVPYFQNLRRITRANNIFAQRQTIYHITGNFLYNPILPSE